MNIVLYSEVYKDQLEKLLKEVSLELFKSVKYDIDSFVRNHWSIYLVIQDEQALGFTSFIYNTYYGFREPSVGQTYLYVTPKYRRTKVPYLLSIQAGKVSIDSNLPLEHYYATEASSRIGKRLKGTQLYTTYIYEVDEVKKVYDKLITKIPIKE